MRSGLWFGKLVGATAPIALAFLTLAAVEVSYFPGRDSSLHVAALRAKAIALSELTAHSVVPALEFEDEALLVEFRNHKIRYAAIGGFALGVLGYSRATMDLDFLVHRDDLEKLHERLTALGYERLMANRKCLALPASCGGLGWNRFCPRVSQGLAVYAGARQKL